MIEGERSLSQWLSGRNSTIIFVYRVSQKKRYFFFVKKKYQEIFFRFLCQVD